MKSSIQASTVNGPVTFSELLLGTFMNSCNLPAKDNDALLKMKRSSFTVKVWPATVIVPERGVAAGFGSRL